MSLTNIQPDHLLTNSQSNSAGPPRHINVNAGSQNLENSSKSVVRNSEPNSGAVVYKEQSSHKPLEHHTSHSERSLMDMLNCEEKEVNLVQNEDTESENEGKLAEFDAPLDLSRQNDSGNFA